ncbi:MAG TPA: SBBP repeat-containing protein [Bryobacteraceae bacterium]|jgi:uncharacterized protein (TIGR03437 family)|nr:SBBP repeat-containing protein [Bryobacteraceae bacterium]
MKNRLAITLLSLAGAVHAAGPLFTTLLGDGYQSYAAAVASDSQGNTYVAGMTAAPDFPTTAGALQSTYAGDFDAFVAKLGPDGKVMWATYLGSTSVDWATGIAVDSTGNVWVCGYTSSPHFPLVNPLQSWLANAPGAYAYGFVSKLSPDGTKLLYSTLLGSTAGSAGTTASPAGIALDSAGNAYVAVNLDQTAGYPGVTSAPAQPGIMVTKLAPQGALIYSYFHPEGAATAIALDSSGAVYVAGSSVWNEPNTSTLVSLSPSLQQAIVFKLSPDGSAKLWEKALGTSAQSAAGAVAVNGAGEVWVGGSTSSANFPLVHPLQNTPGERALWASVNAGASWAPVDNLPFALPNTIIVDPTVGTTFYAATTDLGIFKSVDGGVTWTAASKGIPAGNVSALAIDPRNTLTLFAGTSTGVYKSLDAGNSWTAIDSAPGEVTQLLVDAQNPNNIYELVACLPADTTCASGELGSPNLRVSTNGGATWTTRQSAGYIGSLAADPQVSGHLFAVWNTLLTTLFGPPLTAPELFSTVNGGAGWNMIPGISPGLSNLLVDGSTTPSTVYLGLQYMSADGGNTWTSVGHLPGTTSAGASVAALDPAGNVYAWYPPGGLFVSHDHAQTWSSLGSPFTPIANIFPVTSDGTIFASTPPGDQSAFGTAGFVSKISANGSTLEYSTYLRGHQSAPATVNGLYEPALLLSQNWISGIALDSAGHAIVTGGTRASDFPTANPLQSVSAGLADAFAAVISADGATLEYSTYLGGSQDDGALAVALDPQGNVIVAGETWSGDFPIANGPTLAPGAAGAFVAKLAAPLAPIVTSVVNGASFQPGIAAGSWVTITGSHLANTTGTWQASDFNGNHLPTSVGGVSVTIDGQPAFVEYISPTQINVQAPSDSATGTVNVVVDNNGMKSASAPAQLQTYAPALFLTSGTTAVATVIPGYFPVTSAAPAHPGDLVVLWGTGFGPTTPAAPAGVEVAAAPATATLPTVNIGGLQAMVISSVLTTGSAGLYQITIQIPANAPTGPVAVQVSIGGVQTQSGAVLYIANP